MPSWGELERLIKNVNAFYDTGVVTPYIRHRATFAARVSDRPGNATVGLG